MKSSSITLPFWIGVFLFSIYLLSFSGKLHVMDELAVFTAGHNLAQHGRADINQLIWTNHWTPHAPGIWGQDGNLYTKKAPGISFISVPLLWLAQTLPNLNAVHVGLLTNSFVTALTAAFLFIWLLDLGFSRLAALLTSLGYGLCTIAWVYARMFWELSILGLCFLLALWAARRAIDPARADRRRWWLLLCGSVMALGLTLRFETAVAILFIGLYLVANLRPARERSRPDQAARSPQARTGQIERTAVSSPRPASEEHTSSLRGYLTPPLPYVLRFTFYDGPFLRHLRSTLPSLLLYLAPSLLAALGLAYFNLLRYGSLGETGYTREFLFLKPWVGGYGLLFSPGNGLFIYAPFMLLLFFGLRPAWRRLSRSYFWLIAALVLFYWIFYGSWFAWGGVWVWGPRFFLPTLPLLMLFVAEPLEWVLGGGKVDNIQTSPPGPPKGRAASKIPPSGGSGGLLVAHHANRFSYLKRTGPDEQRQTAPTAEQTAPSLASRFTFYVMRSISRLSRPGTNRLRPLAWAGITTLAVLSLIVNLLGIAVDFNEHFLRLGRNDNFIFNWAAFPPLGHWRILQEGQIDLIWLRPHPGGLTVEWSILIPPLLLLGLAATGLLITLKNSTAAKPTTANLSSSTPPLLSPLSSVLLMSLLTLALLYQMLTATARVALQDEQTQADLPVLNTLTAAARPGDALLIPMPPFGDVQELSTLTMAHLDRPLPASAWIESEPRAISAAERERVWQAAQAEAGRVWLFERWLTPADPLSVTAARFNRQAFPVEERWFEQSGRLSLYALAGETPATTAAPLDVPFEGGLRLVEMAVFGNTLAPGQVLKVRLTWQAPAVEQLAAEGLPAGRIVGFVHLLAEGPPNRKVAQNDRLLLDLQNVERSPLLPGQTIQQGYGLRLPADAPPGSYPLIAGLYLAETGQRLPRADSSPDDFLYLTNIEINSMSNE